MIQGFASPPEEGVVRASPVSLLGEFSIGSIRAGFPRAETGRSLHRVETSRFRIFQGQPLQEGPGVQSVAPSCPRTSHRARNLKSGRLSSWSLLEFLSPPDPFKPIFVYGGKPGVGFMSGDPGVEEIDKVGISLIDGEASSGFE